MKKTSYSLIQAAEEKKIQDIKQIFSMHKAEYSVLSPETAVLNWANPMNGNYAIRYIFDRNALIVTGDADNAVFEFKDTADFETIATKYTLDHFMSKCSVGMQTEFNKRAAACRLIEGFLSEQINYAPAEVVKRYKNDNSYAADSEIAVMLITYLNLNSVGDECLRKELSKAVLAILTEFDTARDWEYILDTEFYDVLSDYDADCGEWIYQIGKEYKVQSIAWYIGLQMAYRQVYSEGK